MKIWSMIKKYALKLLGFKDDADLIMMVIETMITKDVIDKLIEAIKVTATTKMTGAAKKKAVFDLLHQAKGLVKINAKTAGNEIISRTIDLLVNYLKLKGQISSGEKYPDLNKLGA